MTKPRTKTPDLKLNLINDTVWDLKEQNPDSFTLIIFYRGLHCPKCREQLEEITEYLEDFVELGVNIVAASMDTQQRAKQAGEEWEVTSLPIAYGMNEKKAREWGLYISEGISKKEPEIFSEPGLFLIDNEGVLFFSSVQTMPFARPGTKDIINAIKFIQNKDYPARGEK